MDASLARVPEMAKEPTFKPGSVLLAHEFRSIHRDFYKGIYVPAGLDTARSIRFRPILNDEYGYSDRWVTEGAELDYTGQGPPPNSQTWNRWNLGLRNAQERGIGVDVFEVLAGSPRAYLYHGLWRVTRHYEVFNAVQNRSLLRFIISRGESDFRSD